MPRLRCVKSVDGRGPGGAVPRELCYLRSSRTVVEEPLLVGFTGKRGAIAIEGHILDEATVEVGP